MVIYVTKNELDSGFLQDATILNQGLLSQVGQSHDPGKRATP